MTSSNSYSSIINSSDSIILTLWKFTPLFVGVSILILVFKKIVTRGKTSTFFAYQPTPFNEQVVNEIKSRVGDFQPPWWYNNVLCSIFHFGKLLELKFDRQVFTDSENHVAFAVDWYPSRPSADMKDLKICLYFPGLAQTSDHKNNQIFADYMSKRGYYVGIVIPRGLFVPYKSAKLWYPGRHDDGKVVIRDIEQLYPNSKIFLVGLSAGTNLVYRILSESDKSKQIVAALSICVNHRYEDSRTRLESSASGKILSYCIVELNKYMINANQHIHESIGYHRIKQINSCYQQSEFDRVTYKLLGFDSEKDFLAALTSSADHPNINVPMLAIQPVDDPLHAGGHRENIDIDGFYRNPHTIFMEPSHGNHFGFVEGGLLDAVFGESDQCYRYPAQVAEVFFEAVTQRIT